MAPRPSHSSRHSFLSPQSDISHPSHASTAWQGRNCQLCILHGEPAQSCSTRSNYKYNTEARVYIRLAHPSRSGRRVLRWESGILVGSRSLVQAAGFTPQPRVLDSKFGPGLCKDKDEARNLNEVTCSQDLEASEGRAAKPTDNLSEMSVAVDLQLLRPRALKPQLPSTMEMSCDQGRLPAYASFLQPGGGFRWQQLLRRHAQMSLLPRQRGIRMRPKILFRQLTACKQSVLKLWPSPNPNTDADESTFEYFVRYTEEQHTKSEGQASTLSPHTNTLQV